jgi:aryl-alcohol dehydrogenase-like predicted oxidoreductase
MREEASGGEAASKRSMIDPNRRVQLGTTGPSVFPLALGCMGMWGVYGPSDHRESIVTIHEAIDRGVTLLDTGDFYGMGHNELLIRRAIEGGGRKCNYR